MAAFDHRLEQELRLVVAIEHCHLCTRHHDVADLDVGHTEHALEHRQGVTFDDAALRSVA
jgi:hypothetical protein